MVSRAWGWRSTRARRRVRPPERSTGGEGGQEPPELPDDDPSRVWGGFALGLVFALIAAGRGLTGGWDQTAVGLLVGSGGIIVIQLLWLRHRSRRRP